MLRPPFHRVRRRVPLPRIPPAAALPAAVLLTVLYSPAAGQVTHVVSGSVVDAVTGDPIPNAVVSLAEAGSLLSGDDGRFRFTGVAPGGYDLTVEAFGYADFSASLTVADDVPFTIRLVPEPIVLDSIAVEASTIDFDGRVRDGVRDVNLYDARVLSNQGHSERTGWHGRFDLDDVYEGVPLRLVIGAFGYMPLDTTFVPDDEERRDFRLVDDPVGRRMIAEQTRRLDARAADSTQVYRPYRIRPTVGRDDMARYVSRATLQTMLESIYPMSILRKVGCFLVDEVRVRNGLERDHVLRTMLPQEIERVELIEFPDQGGTLMMRVYTRRFFQQLVATDRELRTPNFVGNTRTCV